MNIIRLKIFVLFTVYSIINQLAYGQDTSYPIVKIIPPSPTAAALAKYGDIPVSPYTGVANISVPLYEVKNQNITIPIALNYHSGGIRVEEEASWVGLGWSLSCGGAITRTIRGEDDIPVDGSIGYPDCYIPTSIDNNTNLYQPPSDQNQYNYDVNFLGQVLEGIADAEPDIFVFNFLGRSGKFVLDKRTGSSMPLAARIISPVDIKIEVAYIPAKSNFQWVITDENGVKYFFGTVETVASASGMGEDEFSGDQASLEVVPKASVSSWYLDSIASPSGAAIKLNYYSSYPIGRGTKRIMSRSQLKRHVTQVIATGSCPKRMHEFSYFTTYSEVRDVYLKEIVFPHGKLDFSMSDREDIEPVASGFPPTYAKKLDAISIYSGRAGNYSLVKKYNFNYAYFLSSLDASYSGKRLKLLSVQESNGIQNRPPYVFSYNSLELPVKDSKSQDHWGYFNGADNQSVNETIYGDHGTTGTLIPSLCIYLPGNTSCTNFVGANRTPNPITAQACMLTNILYPSSGSSSFTYELNEYFKPTVVIEERGGEKLIEKFGPNTGVPPFLPDTFTLMLDKQAELELRISTQCYGGNSCIEPGYEFEYDAARIQSLENTPYYNQWIGYHLTYENQTLGIEEVIDVTLPAGKYKFTAFGTENYHSRVLLNWRIKDSITTYNQLGGGQRIKKITHFDAVNHANDQSIEYSYTVSKYDMLASTGVIMVDPIYTYTETISKECPNSIGGGNILQYVARTSAPVIPFANSAQGNPIGYSSVEEIRINEGKTVYEYSNNPDSISSSAVPNVPTIAHLNNGLLLKQTHYRYNSNGTFAKAKEISKVYSNDLSRKVVLKAMKCPPKESGYKYLGNNTFTPIFHNVRFYTIISEWWHPAVDTTKFFSVADDGTYIQEITNYSYNHPVWLQLTNKVFHNSKDETITTSYKYPYDFPSIPVYTQMTNLHQVAPVIEQQEVLNSGLHLRSIKNNYYMWNSNLILPQSVDVKIGNGSTYETRVRSYAYTADGMLLSQSRENDVIISYKWGYDNQYPIVEIHNARENEFYFQSFEEGANIGVVQATSKTGDRVGATGFIVNFSVPNQREYVLTYWYRVNVNSAWIYKELNYTGPSFAITDGVYIDEVRIFPKDALMKTYTYSPMIGLTSETDHSGKTIYYEYNFFNELKLIRDQNNKVLKQHDYQYQTPIQ